MENGFKISINKNSESHWGVDIRIGLFREGLLYIAEPIQFKFHLHHPGDRIQPTLELDDRDGIQFLEALKRAMDEQGGIQEGQFEGELKATKEHLKDL